MEEDGFCDDVDLRVAILALLRRTHLAAESVHHELQAVTNAEDGQSQLKKARISRRRIFVIDRPRRTGKHNTHGPAILNLSERSVAGQYYGENTLFADAARDELRILRAEVEDDDGLNGGGRDQSGLGFHQ